MDREYIAYSGNKFTVEWYYNSKGRSEALDYFKSLTMQERIKVLHLFKRMGDVGEIKDKTKFNYEGDHIYTFKPKPDRFLCFFYVGNKIIVTNAFRKKLPQTEKDRAERNKKDYQLRVKKVNIMPKVKKPLSTFEREMRNTKFKKAFDKGYKEFLLSELLIAIMDEDEISVRALAKEAGLSPTIIQKIRSGKQDDLKISNFVSIAHACGYKVILEKNDDRFEIEDKKGSKKIF